MKPHCVIHYPDISDDPKVIACAEWRGDFDSRSEASREAKRLQREEGGTFDVVSTEIWHGAKFKHARGTRK